MSIHRLPPELILQLLEAAASDVDTPLPPHPYLDSDEDLCRGSYSGRGRSRRLPRSRRRDYDLRGGRRDSPSRPARPIERFFSLASINRSFYAVFKEHKNTLIYDIFTHRIGEPDCEYMDAKYPEDHELEWIACAAAVIVEHNTVHIKQRLSPEAKVSALDRARAGTYPLSAEWLRICYEVYEHMGYVADLLVYEQHHPWWTWYRIWRPERPDLTKEESLKRAYFLMFQVVDGPDSGSGNWIIYTSQFGLKVKSLLSLDELPAVDQFDSCPRMYFNDGGSIPSHDIYSYKNDGTYNVNVRRSRNIQRNIQDLSEDAAEFYFKRMEDRMRNSTWYIKDLFDMLDKRDEKWIQQLIEDVLKEAWDHERVVDAEMQDRWG